MPGITPSDFERFGEGPSRFGNGTSPDPVITRVFESELGISHGLMRRNNAGITR